MYVYMYYIVYMYTCMYILLANVHIYIDYMKKVCKAAWQINVREGEEGHGHRHAEAGKQGDQ